MISWNCLIAVHKTIHKIPSENGYNFRCDKKNRYGNYRECKEEYIVKRTAQRESILKLKLEESISKEER
jgi:hypothetical protein